MKPVLHPSPTLLRAALIGALLPLSLATAASSQTLLPGGERSFPAPDRLLFDVDVHGSQWVLGRTYKASLGATGFTYVPFLGSDAPRNEPVGFRLAGAEVGDEVLDLGGAPRARRDGSVLSLDRGPVEVRYHCAMDAVEQVFVLDPRTFDGDVRLRIEVTSRSTMQPHEGGLRFTGDRGWTDYGAAVAIAPDGRRSPVEILPGETGFDLVVPGAFARTVEGPLVIDPLISTGTVSLFLFGHILSVDVGADEDVGFVAAVERQFSLTDSDVYLYEVGSATAAGTLQATIDFTTTTWREPSVAGREVNEEFLVVATAGEGTARRVFGREVSANDWSPELPFRISPDIESYSPDVGADNVNFIFANNIWMVVWESALSSGDTNIYMQRVGTSGPFGNLTGIAVSSAAERMPCISENAGPRGTPNTQRFVVAYATNETLGGTINTVELTNTGGFTGGGVVVPALLPASLDVTASAAEVLPGGERPYLLAYGTRALIGDGRFVRVAVAAGSSVLGTALVAELSDEDLTDRHTSPAAAVSEDRWFVAYETADSAAAQRDLWLATGDISAGHFGLALRREPLANVGMTERGLAMTTLYEASGRVQSAPRTFAAWVEEDSTNAARGALAVAPTVKAAGRQYCAAENHSGGTSGWLTVTGETDTTSPKLVRAFDLPVGQTCLLLTSRSTNFVPGVGGSAGNLCLGGMGFGRFNGLVNTSSPSGTYQAWIDPTMLPQPTAFVGAIPGETWYFQVWFRDFQGAPTSNLTNAFALEFE